MQYLFSQIKKKITGIVSKPNFVLIQTSSVTSGSCETLARIRGAREREAGPPAASRTMTLRRSLLTVKHVIIE